MSGKAPLSEYAAAISRQEAIYPDNYVKLRYLENHDRPRAAHLIPDARALRNWTAFSYFQKGLTMLYAGQEVQSSHTPSLFDKDTVQWNWSRDISPLLRTLAQIKRDPIFTDSTYTVQSRPGDILVAVHSRGDRKMAGIFSTRGQAALVNVDLPNGIYPNLITGEPIEVRDGLVPSTGEPIILKIAE